MSTRGSILANELRREEFGVGGFPSSDPVFHDHMILAKGDSWCDVARPSRTHSLN